MGITPLMLCVYLKKEKLLSALYLQGASPFCVPLTCMEDPDKYFEDIKAAVLKTKISEFQGLNIKIPPYIRQMKSVI